MSKTNLKYFIILLAILTLSACYSKPQSLELAKIIKEDIKQTEQKVIKVEKDYKKLIQEQPSCEVSTIIDNVEYIKSDMSLLSSKIEATETVIKVEAKSYQKEIRYLKLINYALITAIGIIIFLIIKIRIK